MSSQNNISNKSTTSKTPWAKNALLSVLAATLGFSFGINYDTYFASEPKDAFLIGKFDSLKTVILKNEIKNYFDRKFSVNEFETDSSIKLDVYRLFCGGDDSTLLYSNSFSKIKQNNFPSETKSVNIDSIVKATSDSIKLSYEDRLAAIKKQLAKMTASKNYYRGKYLSQKDSKKSSSNKDIYSPSKAPSCDSCNGVYKPIFKPSRGDLK